MRLAAAFAVTLCEVVSLLTPQARPPAYLLSYFLPQHKSSKHKSHKKKSKKRRKRKRDSSDVDSDSESETSDDSNTTKRKRHKKKRKKKHKHESVSRSDDDAFRLSSFMNHASSGEDSSSGDSSESE